MNHHLVAILGSILALTALSCATAPAEKMMTAAECAQAKACTVSGTLEMSNDGHAYIGKLHLADGSCVNVSLPDSESRRRSEQVVKMITVTGRVLPYVRGDTIVEQRVNGREIGVGTCGDYFVFVE